MKKVVIYTDGACSGNPGPGGYAAILRYKNHESVVSGGKAQTTNNRMELLAAIEALKKLKEPCRVILYSDSAYLVNGMVQWIDKWRVNGWKTASKKRVENRELWESLIELSAKHEIEWRKVAGHSGQPENERCDSIAREEIEKLQY